MGSKKQAWTELRVLRTKDGQTLTDLHRNTAITDSRGNVIEKGIALSYLSELESGTREPNPRVIKRLARALNVPMSMLEKRRNDVDPS